MATEASKEVIVSPLSFSRQLFTDKECEVNLWVAQNQYNVASLSLEAPEEGGVILTILARPMSDNRPTRVILWPWREESFDNELLWRMYKQTSILHSRVSTFSWCATSQGTFRVRWIVGTLLIPAPQEP